MSTPQAKNRNPFHSAAKADFTACAAKLGLTR
jgi:hypothetical protein